jgi:hypothetical protein
LFSKYEETEKLFFNLKRSSNFDINAKLYVFNKKYITGGVLGVTKILVTMTKNQPIKMDYIESRVCY